MKQIFAAFLLLLASASTYATAYTYKVDVPELQPGQALDKSINVVSVSQDKYTVSTTVQGDWPEVIHAVSGGYYGLLTITRQNTNRDAGKLATTITVIVQIEKRVGGSTGEEETELPCLEFPFCAPPPPAIARPDVQLESIAKLSADGRYLLLWVAESGGRVIPLKEDGTIPTLNSLRRKRGTVQRGINQ